MIEVRHPADLREWNEAEKRFNPDLRAWLKEHDYAFEDWPGEIETEVYREAVLLFGAGEGLNDDGWPMLEVQ